MNQSGVFQSSLNSKSPQQQNHSLCDSFTLNEQSGVSFRKTLLGSTGQINLQWGGDHSADWLSDFWVFLTTQYLKALRSFLAFCETKSQKESLKRNCKRETTQYLIYHTEDAFRKWSRESASFIKDVYAKPPLSNMSSWWLSVGLIQANELFNAPSQGVWIIHSPQNMQRVCCLTLLPSMHCHVY